ncbi:MAG: hypothetical protein WA030_02415 [Candidatus Microsaccharimonas sp.]
MTYGARTFNGEYSSDLPLQYNNARFSIIVYESGITVIDCDGSYDKLLTPIDSGLNLVEVNVY